MKRFSDEDYPNVCPLLEIKDEPSDYGKYCTCRCRVCGKAVSEHIGYKVCICKKGVQGWMGCKHFKIGFDPFA